MTGDSSDTGSGVQDRLPGEAQARFDAVAEATLRKRYGHVRKLPDSEPIDRLPALAQERLDAWAESVLGKHHGYVQSVATDGPDALPPTR
jgi:hypothetical protein